MRSLEALSNNKEEPIRITLEEWREFVAEGQIDDPKLLEWMERKGIEFDSGIVEIVQDDGKIRKMDTSKKDFGIFIEDPAEDEDDEYYYFGREE